MRIYIYADAYRVDDLKQFERNIARRPRLKHFQDGQHPMRRDQLRLHFRSVVYDVQLQRGVSSAAVIVCLQQDSLAGRRHREAGSRAQRASARQ